METGHFSFHTSFLGRLYHLITWRGGFNYGSGPVYFGMGRISLWPGLRYWVGSSNPFIRQMFRLTYWACAHCFGPHHMETKLYPLNLMQLKLFIDSPSEIDNITYYFLTSNITQQ